MSNPPIFCDGNCGDGEEVPEFITVYVPIIDPAFSDYNVGVRYKFDVQEATRCVWIPENPTVGNWTIEKLSRYPLGWRFPSTEPVAGQWTYRLSIDRMVPPLFAGGWTGSYFRFVAGQNDPLRSCVQQQALRNYVPLVTRPPANIVPMVDDLDYLLPKQNNSGCFCSEGCQPGVVPYSKYFVQCLGAFNYPNFDLGKLMLFNASVSGVCDWEVAETEIGPDTLRLFQRDDPILFTEDGNFEFNVQEVSGAGTVNYLINCRWSKSGSPFPGPSSNCNLPYWCNSDPDKNCRLVPCPDWICDDEAARQWFSGISAVPS